MNPRAGVSVWQLPNRLPKDLSALDLLPDDRVPAWFKGRIGKTFTWDADQDGIVVDTEDDSILVAKKHDWIVMIDVGDKREFIVLSPQAFEVLFGRR